MTRKDERFEGGLCDLDFLFFFSFPLVFFFFLVFLPTVVVGFSGSKRAAGEKVMHVGRLPSKGNLASVDGGTFQSASKAQEEEWDFLLVVWILCACMHLGNFVWGWKREMN